MGILRSVQRIVKNAVIEGVEIITPIEVINVGKRLLNKDFMRAFSAATALVAIADGSYDNDEKDKIRAYIEKTDILDGFNSAKVLPIVQGFVDTLLTDRDLGERKAYSALKLIDNDDDYCNIIIKICIEIGKSGGNFDGDEKFAVANICDKLGVDKREYGL